MHMKTGLRSCCRPVASGLLIISAGLGILAAQALAETPSRTVAPARKAKDGQDAQGNQVAVLGENALQVSGEGAIFASGTEAGREDASAGHPSVERAAPASSLVPDAQVVLIGPVIEKTASQPMPMPMPMPAPVAPRISLLPHAAFNSPVILE